MRKVSSWWNVDYTDSTVAAEGKRTSRVRTENEPQAIFLPNNEQNEPTQGDIGKTSNELTQAKSNEFEELYASANEELYPDCDYVTRLDFMAKFTTLRLQNLYKSSHTVKEMTWHATGKCTEPGKMQHPVDGRSWKNFDSKYPNFVKEPRNVKLGLAADGFNPFGKLSQAYSMWLALKGVKTIDVATVQKFNMRAMVLWTINDFPSRSSLSGWSGQGYKACLTCNEDTPSVRVLGKTPYVGHRRFLKKPHKWRRLLEFNAKIKDGDPLRKFNKDQIQTQLARLPMHMEEMSANVARGHGGDSGGDDRPLHTIYPPVVGVASLTKTKAPENTIWVEGKRAGCIPARRPRTSDHAFHWSNYLRELIREMPLYYPSWQKVLAEWKAAIVTNIGEEMLRLQALGSNTPSGVPYTEEKINALARKGKQRGHLPGVGRVLPRRATDVLSPPPPQCTHNSADVKKLKKQVPNQKAGVAGAGMMRWPMMRTAVKMRKARRMAIVGDAI
nr:hypothetical protein [Tanacetum cinerariifolium]